MKHSPLVAPLRIYDTGKDRVAAYYLDIFDEQQFIGLWQREEVGGSALKFALSHDFDCLTLQIVHIKANIGS